MIQSMTGFGKAQGEYLNKKFTVEIRSLNSKGLDLSVRMASVYREKELDLRNFISRRLERGKIDLSIYFENNGEQKIAINKALLAAYYSELQGIQRELGIASQPEFLSLLLNMPDVMQSQREELDEAEWAFVMQLVEQAAQHFDQFRMQEGAVLGHDLLRRVATIAQLLTEVEVLAEQRKPAMRTRLLKALDEIRDRYTIDEGRFEQELVYYLEKLDITEEQVRLRSHCTYFNETLQASSHEGKKLGFIAQEMGREINTIGSKCNDPEIQRLVVQMKDELEKVKEQLLNLM